MKMKFLLFLTFLMISLGTSADEITIINQCGNDKFRPPVSKFDVFTRSVDCSGSGQITEVIGGTLEGSFTVSIPKLSQAIVKFKGPCTRSVGSTNFYARSGELKSGDTVYCFGLSCRCSKR